MRAASTFLASIVALALAGAAYVKLTDVGDRHANGSSPTSGHRGSGLKVLGHIEGLYPGVTEVLPVKVKSRLPFRVRIRSIRTVVDDAGPSCSAANLRVPGYTGRLKIRPRRSRRVNLRIAMPAAAADACQGASFPLRFRARATR
jgi:hypothetical protein